MVDKDKKFGMMVLGALLLGAFFISYFSSGHQNAEKRVVQGQLDAIEEKRLTEAYYGFTSKDFQLATPLDGFKKFLSNLPVLAAPHAVFFEHGNSPGEVFAVIKGDKDQLKLLYTLSKSEDAWKVQKIELVNENNNLPDFDSAIFLEPVKNHIEALKENNLQKAYQNTSSAFQEATPLTEFTEFVKDFPVFSEKGNVEYKKLTFNNNIGTYEVLMKAENGSIYDLKYDLIAENGIWKILQIQIEKE